MVLKTLQSDNDLVFSLLDHWDGLFQKRISFSQ